MADVFDWRCRRFESTANWSRWGTLISLGFAVKTKSELFIYWNDSASRPDFRVARKLSAKRNRQHKKRKKKGNRDPRRSLMRSVGSARLSLHSQGPSVETLPVGG